jgi:hypothetical protein
MTDNITLPSAVVEQVREVLKELDYASEPYVNEIARTTLAALDAALAEPDAKPEPVAHVENGVLVRSALPKGYTGPLYAAPPQPDAIARAVEAEREACARVCEPQEKWDDPLTAWSIAQAIRERGSK